MVCLLAALWVQSSVSVGNGWPHNALRHHWLMPISCHFRDCKALLVTSLTHVSSAMASVQTFTFTNMSSFVRWIKVITNDSPYRQLQQRDLTTTWSLLCYATAVSIIIIIISGLYRQECIARLEASSLHSGRFWTILTTSANARQPIWDNKT